MVEPPTTPRSLLTTLAVLALVFPGAASASALDALPDGFSTVTQASGLTRAARCALPEVEPDGGPARARCGRRPAWMRASLVRASPTSWRWRARLRGAVPRGSYIVSTRALDGRGSSRRSDVLHPAAHPLTRLNPPAGFSPPQIDAMAVPRFRVWSTLWTDYPAQAQELARGAGVTRVCELGGGANPIIPLELIAKHGLEHEVADISADELAKAPEGYRTVQTDAMSPDFQARGPYDLIVTAFLAEHVPDPRAFHSAVHAVLRPGGLALHVFPTLYEPTFVANLLLAERVTDPLLRRIQDHRDPEGPQRKFRAYYRWCRGPTRRQIRRLEDVGFEVLDYVGYFGHGYFRKISPLHHVEQALSRSLARHPVPAFTSYATVVLRRR